MNDEEFYRAIHTGIHHEVAKQRVEMKGASRTYKIWDLYCGYAHENPRFDRIPYDVFLNLSKVLLGAKGMDKTPIWANDCATLTINSYHSLCDEEFVCGAPPCTSAYFSKSLRRKITLAEAEVDQ